MSPLLPRARMLSAACLVTMAATSSLSSAAEWTSLFNGRDLEGWSPLLDPKADIAELVKVKDGTMHIYAENESPHRVPFGVLMTDASYQRFHLRLQYRWGGKKFEPRANDLRDAGILYHIYKAERVWPRSVECQIQEGDTGDLIFLSTGGVTWISPKPEDAPEGQGDPGRLPETGGIARAFHNREFGPYIGRLPELDTHEGWNTVDVIVHGADSAVHVVNGTVCARVFDMRKPVDEAWVALDRGQIAIQLEGAELFYRNIEIRELPPAMELSTRYVALSSVANAESGAETLTVTNPGPHPRTFTWTAFGESPDLFDVTGDKGRTLQPGESAQIRITFGEPPKAGRYSAGLRIGEEEDGAFAVLQGLRLEAMEGSNEPPLARILDALGAYADVGGPGLGHNAQSDTLGSSVAGGKFRALGEVTVTPLARFSPPGAVPFGFTVGGKETEIGTLTASDSRPDAHQCLWPPLADGESKVLFDAPSEPFALFAKPAEAVLSTDPAQSVGAKVKRAARIWPIEVFGGRLVENTFLVGFEEARNGDYQDVLFLIENVEISDSPHPGSE